MQTLTHANLNNMCDADALCSTIALLLYKYKIELQIITKTLPGSITLKDIHRVKFQLSLIFSLFHDI